MSTGGAYLEWAAVVKAGFDVSYTGDEDQSHRLVVAKVENSTPKAGRITWTDENGGRHEVGAADKVTIFHEREE